LGDPREPSPLPPAHRLPTARPPPAHRPPTDWTELVQVRDHRSIFQTSPEELPVIDIRVF
jgi:hypothetical protein